MTGTLTDEELDRFAIEVEEMADDAASRGYVEGARAFAALGDKVIAAARSLAAVTAERDALRAGMAEIDDQLTNAGPHIAEAGFVGQYIGHHVDLAISMARAHRSDGRHYMHETIEFWQRKCAAAEAESAALRKVLEPFDRADNADWNRLNDLLGQSAHGKFWRDLLAEVDDAIRARTTLKENTNG